MRTIIRINPDTDLVQEIKKELKENDGYCPCVIEKSESTKCMCAEFRKMESGECHCGLYQKIIVDE